MERFPEHIAAAWIGNTVQVARRHYLQVTEEALQKAMQNPLHAAHAGRNQPSSKKPQNLAFPEKGEVCAAAQTHYVEPIRLELTTSSLQK